MCVFERKRDRVFLKSKQAQDRRNNWNVYLDTPFNNKTDYTLTPQRDYVAGAERSHAQAQGAKPRTYSLSHTHSNACINNATARCHARSPKAIKTLRGPSLIN